MKRSAAAMLFLGMGAILMSSASSFSSSERLQARKLLVYDTILVPRSRLASALDKAGIGYEVAAELPDDLSGYSAIWHVEALIGPKARDAILLEKFVRNGGNLHLTGEWPENRDNDAMLERIVNAVIEEDATPIQIPDDPSPSGPYSYGAAAVHVFGDSDPPNMFDGIAVGRLLGVSRENVLVVAKDGSTVGALWTKADLKPGCGKLTVLMDNSWLLRNGAEQVVQGVAQFLMREE